VPYPHHNSAPKQARLTLAHPAAVEKRAYRQAAAAMPIEQMSLGKERTH